MKRILNVIVFLIYTPMATAGIESRAVEELTVMSCTGSKGFINIQADRELVKVEYTIDGRLTRRR